MVTIIVYTKLKPHYQIAHYSLRHLFWNYAISCQIAALSSSVVLALFS